MNRHHSIRLRFGSACLISLLLLCAGLTAEEPELKSSLGLPVILNDFYIPGQKAEPIPRKDRESSLVIRILKIKPAADGFRYDLEIYGLDPGTYKLSDYFHYAGENAAVPDLATRINITTAHDPAVLPKPVELTNEPPEKLGGYRQFLTIIAVLWGIIFFIILFYRKKNNIFTEESKPPPTLHEKLQSLVHAAAQGELDDAERSQLERLIIGHWKRRLPELENCNATEALVQLRAHPEASPLLLKLEHWLHAPNPSVKQQDVRPLLEPFRDTRDV
ncbi:MAG: hypothetical protein AB8F34_12225 [Akkermansiaceae bacterium]